MIIINIEIIMIGIRIWNWMGVGFQIDTHF